MNKLFVLLALTGCATSPPLQPELRVAEISPVPPETRVTEISQETRVCINGGPLTAGEQITVQRKICRPASAKSTAMRCTPEELGAAEVLRVLDAHCAIVRLPFDAQLRTGDVLQVVSRR
jgi:hypothetical protein